MNKNILMMALGTMIGLSACNDFLDTVPKGKVIPTTVSDFGNIMNDPTFPISYSALPYFCSDDVKAKEESVDMTSHVYKAYFWQKNFYKREETDANWNDMYSKIYTANVVLENVMGATEGSQEDKNRIMAEARMYRAYCLWCLQNIYGPASNNKNAGSEMSVPMPLEANLEAKLKRNSMNEVNTQIVNDLDKLEEYLPKNGSNIFKPNKAAAYAMRARVLFYMGEYDKAGDEAQKALELKSDIDDMRKWEFSGPFPSGKIKNRKEGANAIENIWYHSCNGSNLLRLTCISDELKALYEEYPNDLRMKFWFSNVDDTGKPFYKDNSLCYIQTTPDHNIAVPEMMLIRAEALARKGDSKALDILNELRKFRFAEADYKPLTAADGKDLLQTVLDERRRELAVSNLRWFDMKRLAAEGLYTKTLTRTIPEGETCTLEPNSDKYQFPIPLSIMKVNGNIQPNKRQE